jgi:ornithine carbamoyltransferase
MAKHFISIEDYTSDQLLLLLDQSAQLKELYRNGGRDLCLTGKTMVMLFEKPSSRTRFSFQVGFTQLGGDVIYTRPEDIGGPLGRREPIKDITRVLNGYVDVIVARTFAHQTVLELARYATVPVINALSDMAHPCQAMADMLTIREHFGVLEGLTLAYIGDANNVTYSLAMACGRLGLKMIIAVPTKYAFDDETMDRLRGRGASGQLVSTTDPYEAVKNADVIYTDTWTSMGQEDYKQQRIKDFQGFQVDRGLLDAAPENAKVMHCLPAYRGLEITDEVIESPQSIVFDQAENRLHFQRALLKYLLTDTDER